MATFPLISGVDDSEFENVGGLLRRRPMPGLEHAALQHRITNLLEPVAGRRNCKVLQEWSISDGVGHWLTPDVMMSGPEFRLTPRGHLWAPPPPHLVVEIRSPDQPLRDLFDKMQDYRAYQVPFYWIVDPVERACYEGLLSEMTIRAANLQVSAADFSIGIERFWEAE